MKEDKPKLSYSRCEVFLDCREKYRWIYIEDLVSVKRSWAPSVGIIVHHILFLNNKGLLEQTPMEDLYSWAEKEMPDSTEEERKGMITDAAMLVNGYLQTLKTSEIKIVSPEVALEKDYGDFILYSRLDGLCQTPDDRVWRLEYKTTSRTDSAYLSGLRKGLQTGIAHLLAEDLLDTKISGTIFSLLVKTKIPQYPYMPCTKDRWVIDYARKVVEGITRSIQRGDFYPSLHCSPYGYECDYKHLCSSGGSEQVRKNFYKKREVIQDQNELAKVSN